LGNQSKRIKTGIPEHSIRTNGLSPKPNNPKTQTINQSYDAAKYIKNDLKWSGIAAGIVMIVMILCYILFR
jgi:hypothetical protein